MNQRELIEKFMNQLNLSSPSAGVKEDLLSYLIGETEAMPAFPGFKSYVPYNLYSDLANQFGSADCGEAAKRIYRFLGKTMGKSLLKANLWNIHALSEFSQAQIGEELVMEYVSHKIFELLEGYRWRYREKLAELEGIASAPKASLSGLGELFLYYGDLVNRMIQEEADSPSLVTLTLLTASCFWYQNEPDKRDTYASKTSEVLYGALKALNQESENPKEKLSELLAASSLALYRRVMPYKLGMEDKLLRQAVLSVASLLCSQGPVFTDAVKMSLLTMEAAVSYEIFHEPLEVLYLREKQLKLPQRVLTELAADGIFLENFRMNSVKNFSLLEECYRTDRETLLTVYQKSVKCRDRKMLSLSALLCMMEPDGGGPCSYQKQADDNFLSYISWMKENNKIEIQGDFYERAELRFPNKIQSAADLLVGCTVLYQLSEAARGFYRSCFLQYYSLLRTQGGYTGGSVQSVNPCCFLMGSYSTWTKALVPAVTGEGQGKELGGQLWERLAESVGVYELLDAAALAGVGNEKSSFLLFAKGHLELAEKVYQIILEEQTETVTSYMDLYYRQDIGMSPELLCKTMEHRLKTVVSHVEAFAADREATLRGGIEALSQSKNKNAREAAARLLKKWDEEKIAGQMTVIEDGALMAAYLEQTFGKSVKSKPAVPYGDQLNLSGVRLRKTGENAPSVLLEYYLSEYMLLKEIKVLKPCEEIRRLLEEESLLRLITDVYQLWMEQGAEAKLKNLLLPYAISATAKEVLALKKQIDEWTENSRGALAAFAVSALALNGSNMALLIIDGISKKYKNKQVKAAAETAMAQAAALLEITKEELGDRIIPDLGFSKNRERMFDFGSRAFRGVLTAKLEVELYEENGKCLKTMPKPGAKDDAEIAGRTVSEFKDLKKQLKTVVSSQKVRLEEALTTGRVWDQFKWNQLFVENPVMNVFAIGLIWEELDRAGNLRGTFRYMEDGSFNTAEEEEAQLQPDSVIALLHPLDMSPELLEKWKEQLADYEIVQPLPQLDLEVYRLTQEEKKLEKVSRFAGKTVYFGTIRGVMEKYGWRKTSILDGGGYEGYYYENAASLIGVQIVFDFLYVGMGNDDTVTVNDMQFYRTGSVFYGSYVYDEIAKENRVAPKDVPEKLMNFALMAGEQLVLKAI